MSDADRILLVDDDPGIRELLVTALGFSGFDVEAVADMPAALRAIAQREPAAIVLDVGLPGGDGFDLLRLLRAQRVTVPVLFLTSRDSVDDRVHGLQLGGDDYVTKPFSVVEISARLTALLRRARGSAGGSPEDGLLRCADLELDEARHEVRRGGQPVALSPTEFRLLHYLLTNQGHVLTRSQILQEVWQYDFGGESVVVERFVSNLRRKLDDGREPLIHTIRGIGYSLRPSGSRPDRLRSSSDDRSP